MNEHDCSTLMQVFQGIPDPRMARGKRYEWDFLLALISAAIACGQKSARGIAQWIQLNASVVLANMHPPRDSMPSESTIRRTLGSVPVETLEARLTRLGLALIRSIREVQCRKESSEPEEERLQGRAMDGKEVRGVRAHGQRTVLISLIEHDSGVVCAQRAVEQGSNEITAAPKLLQGLELQGTVITMDALLTQRSLARQILKQNGHYLMVVKDNQPELRRAIALLFDEPPWLPRDRDQEYRMHCSTEKGHGRIETRVLETSNALSDYLDWPGVGQVMRRSCRRVKTKTGEVESHSSYGITSLDWTQADAAQIETLWRGHWAIENRVHHVRDATMGEDACQMRTGDAPQVLAALRNAVLSLLRWLGWQNIADALRYYAVNFQRSLQLVGAISDQL